MWRFRIVVVLTLHVLLVAFAVGSSVMVLFEGGASEPGQDQLYVLFMAVSVICATFALPAWLQRPPE